MTELLGAISAAVSAAGHTVDLAFDEFPPIRDDCAYVTIPHEFNAWGATFPGRAERELTIALCTENAGTEWFEETYRLVSQFATAVSINRSSAAELQRRGVRCEHIQLGYVPLWDTWYGDQRARRDLDVLYLGAADPRRDPLLAQVGEELWARNGQLLIPPLEPRTRPRPDFLIGDDKYHRLRSAQVLLNLHRTTSSALEWMRFLEAIANGCVVVSEPCRDSEPLVPGEHFVAVAVDVMGRRVNALLDEPESVQQMRQRAYDFVRNELPMEPVGHQLADLAAELPRQLPRGGSRAQSPAVCARTDDALGASPRQTQAIHSSHQSRRHFKRSFGISPAGHIPTPMLHGLRAATSHFRSRVQRHTVHKTEAYEGSGPRISVLCVAASDSAALAVAALASVAASDFDELEVLAMLPSTGDPELKDLLRNHPRLPAILQSHSVTGGLGSSLNQLVELARGEYLFVLDARGGIYPSTLSRLAAALDAAPEALFCYSIVGVFDGDRPVQLLGSLPWEPDRLSRGNWIDSMALLRREALLELGCFSTDPRLAGWEAFELWCKCAQAGGYGVHVPQVLAWRQLAETVSPPAADIASWTALRERYPGLLTTEPA